jgi:outer membrane protein TolC
MPPQLASQDPPRSTKPEDFPGGVNDSAGRVDRVAAEFPAESPSDAAAASFEPLAVGGALSPDRLVEEVLAQNPSLQAMVEAWRAAAARYPQMISLEDPMFRYMKGTQEGWMIEASQKLPWPGKRGLRGDVADAEANAACHEVEDARLRLAEAAKMAFLDYYQADRQLAVNAATVELFNQYREIARAKYEANQATQQDVLQAEVEIARLGTRRAELRRAREVAAARINTLLHREAAHPLPPPPASIAVPDRLPDAAGLQALAVAERPDLAALAFRVEAEGAAAALACKEYYPDLELMVKHDAFMPEEMRTQVGVGLNVPIYRQKRHAAVSEASARASQRRAEYQDRLDQVAFEVQSAVAQLAEGREVVELYAKKILPTAEANVESARINYTANRLDFLRLIEAQRQLRELQETSIQALADYHRRLAELERIVGRRPAIAQQE